MHLRGWLHTWCTLRVVVVVVVVVVVAAAAAAAAVLWTIADVVNLHRPFRRLGSPKQIELAAARLWLGLEVGVVWQKSLLHLPF